MRTATVTWITYNNYGTALQAFALQQFLRDNGIENDIIDDYYIVTGGECRNSDESKQIKDSLLLYSFKNIFHPRKLFRRYKKAIRKNEAKRKIRFFQNYIDSCDRFKRDSIVIKSVFDGDYSSLNGYYDIFIAGSDQTWSTLEHNFNGYFYLSFVTGKKISYAASIGANCIPEEKRANIIEWLKDYSAISVRESQTARQLSEMIGRSVSWVCDPTLLHDRYFWDRIAISPKMRKKYLLCYLLENREWYISFAKELAEKYRLEIVLLPSRKEFCSSEYLYRGNASPEGFVGLIRECEFVLTDSYHGMLFSLIYEKQFVLLKRFLDSDENCQNIRVYSVLGYLGIETALLDEQKANADSVRIIDYTQIGDKLNDFRNRSRGFLLRELGFEDY